MRHARIKPEDKTAWHHCYNRTCGTSHDRPFANLEKEQFVRILTRVCQLYTVRVIAYQVMSNHYHLLVQVPVEQPTEKDICDRFALFHEGTRVLMPGSLACRIWQERARDVSWFMRHIQQLYTTWYNRTRPVQRRGSIWSDRFKNTILEEGPAVWACWKYIENNAVRAGMVNHAADYRFGSYGVWCQSGRHPFHNNLQEAVYPASNSWLGVTSAEEIRIKLQQALEEGERQQENSSDVVVAVQRRVRYWTCGLIIGSELFVREMMGRFKKDIHPRPLQGHPEICASRCARAESG